MMDETRDMLHTDQVSIFVRYVNCNEEAASVEERIPGLVTVEGKFGEALESLLLNTLQNNDPDTDNVGQYYDGGSNVAGAFSGVQARILEKKNLRAFLKALLCT